MSRKNKFSDVSYSDINSLRKELLKTGLPSRPINPYKFGIAYTFEQHEKYNGTHLSGKKTTARKACCLSKISNRKLSRRNSIDLEHCSPSSITRVIVSKKKLERNQKLLIGKDDAYEKCFSNNNEMTVKEKAKESLKQIRAFGLYMRELRGDMIYNRSKSANRKKQQKTERGSASETAMTLSAKKDHDTKDSTIEKIFKEDIIRPRRDSIVQAFNNITSFVKSLMMMDKIEEKPIEESKEVIKPTRKCSSFYSNLSEGSLTDEESESDEFSENEDSVATSTSRKIY